MNPADPFQSMLFEGSLMEMEKCSSFSVNSDFLRKSKYFGTGTTATRFLPHYLGIQPVHSVTLLHFLARYSDGGGANDHDDERRCLEKGDAQKGRRTFAFHSVFLGLLLFKKLAIVIPKASWQSHCNEVYPAVTDCESYVDAPTIYQLKLPFELLTRHSSKNISQKCLSEVAESGQQLENKEREVVKSPLAVDLLKGPQDVIDFILENEEAIPAANFEVGYLDGLATFWVPLSQFKTRARPIIPEERIKRFRFKTTDGELAHDELLCGNSDEIKNTKHTLRELYRSGTILPTTQDRQSQKPGDSSKVVEELTNVEPGKTPAQKKTNPLKFSLSDSYCGDVKRMYREIQRNLSLLLRKPDSHTYSIVSDEVAFQWAEQADDKQQMVKYAKRIARKKKISSSNNDDEEDEDEDEDTSSDASSDSDGFIYEYSTDITNIFSVAIRTGQVDAAQILFRAFPILQVISCRYTMATMFSSICHKPAVEGGHFEFFIWCLQQEYGVIEGAERKTKEAEKKEAEQKSDSSGEDDEASGDDPRLPENSLDDADDWAFQRTSSSRAFITDCLEHCSDWRKHSYDLARLDDVLHKALVSGSLEIAEGLLLISIPRYQAALDEEELVDKRMLNRQLVGLAIKMKSMPLLLAVGGEMNNLCMHAMSWTENKKFRYHADAIWGGCDSPLALAIESGSLLMVQTIVNQLKWESEAGALFVPPTATDQAGSDPTINALISSHFFPGNKFPVDAVDTFRENCANSGLLFVRKSDGDLPLHVAAKVGSSEDIVKFLIAPLEEGGAGMTWVDVKSNMGWTPLKIALSKGYVHIGKILLDHGAKADQTMLHLAAVNNFPEVCRLLVEKGGVAVDAPDTIGRTPLQKARAKKLDEICNTLTDLGAKE